MLKDNSAQGHPLTAKQKKYFGYIAGGGTPKSRKSITIPKKELVEEHEHLIQTLKTGGRARLKQEATKQSKELKEYKAKRKLKRGMMGYRK